MAAELVPALVIGPVAGVFADRWDRRRTMLVCDLLRAVAVASMLLVRSPGQVWILYVALMVEAAVGLFFAPSSRALLPALLGRGPDLAAANSLSALVGGTVRLVGGPAGGALYAFVGFGPVALLDAASFAASAVLITAIRFRPAQATAGPDTEAAEAAEATEVAAVTEAAEGTEAAEPAPTIIGRFRTDLRAGATHIRATPALPALFLAAAVFFLGNAMLTALLVPYVGTVLHAASGTMGLLFSALGVGYLAGAPVSRAVASRLSVRATVVGSLASLSAVFAAAFAVNNTVWDLVLFTLIGPPAVCFLVTVDTSIARHTPDRLLGRVGSVYGTLVAAATLVGMLGGAALGQRFGIAATLNLAVVTVLVSALVGLRIPHSRQFADLEPV